MSDPQRNQNAGQNHRAIMPSSFMNQSNTVDKDLTDEIIDTQAKLILSIRGGGGGEGQKRKLAEIADNEYYNSEEDKDFRPGSGSSSSGTKQQPISSSSNNNNITKRLRNTNNRTLSSPPKPPPNSSSSNNTTTRTSPTRTTTTSPQRIMDVKSSSVASPGGQQAQIKQDTGNKDPSGSTKVKQGMSQAASHQQPTLPDAQRRILQTLESLCDHYSQDIRFSFIPSTVTTTNNNKSRIDLSGSFLRSEEESLDFFDLNDKGEITLQPRPPIFPEELSSSGMREHSLRWWGVEDPAVGDGRFKATVSQHAAPPGDDRSRQTMMMMNDSHHNHRRGDEYSNGHDRNYNNSRDFPDPHGPPPPPGGPPYSDRSRGPDRRRDRR